MIRWLYLQWLLKKQVWDEGTAIKHANAVKRQELKTLTDWATLSDQARAAWKKFQ